MFLDPITAWQFLTTPSRSPLHEEHLRQIEAENAEDIHETYEAGLARKEEI